MRWSSAPFKSLYSSIENGQFDYKLYGQVLPDLKKLNLCEAKGKDRASLENTKKFTADDGTVYEVNQEFLISAVALSDELNLDESAVMNLILSVGCLDEDSLAISKKAKIEFYLRRQYILQIVAYVVNSVPAEDRLYKELIADKSILSNIFKAFSSIHAQLADIKQLASKHIILDTYDALAKQNSKFKIEFLVKEYDILSQILYGLVEKRTFISKDHFLQIIEHVSVLQSNDFFIIYYLPAIFLLCSRLNDFEKDSQVFEIHSLLTKELQNENIYEQPVKVAIIFIFLSNFIGWCKLKPMERAKKVDFTTAVDEPLTLAVELGAIEQILVFAADTSETGSSIDLEMFYNFRSLLERHIPRLFPIQLQIDSPKSSLTHESDLQCSAIALSPQANAFFLNTFHSVLQVIISECAFLLTKIKDAEEDSLLSGEDLTLDDISIKADLERFFMTIYFFYAARPTLASTFWSDRNSTSYGFIEWASKCSDSLMRSCYYMMLSSLSSGRQNALNTYYYFSGRATTGISWQVISQYISENVLKISALANQVQQQKISDSTPDIDYMAVALQDGLNEEAIAYLSSLLTLVGSVSQTMDEEIKGSLADIFTDVLFEFLKLNTPLAGACFKTLSYLVPKSEKKREKYWKALDMFLFKGSSLSSTSESYRNIFTGVITSFPEVIGFLDIFKALISINSKDPESEYMVFGMLPYPAGLGRGYRRVGVWPYFDYIFNEILLHLNQLKSVSKKRIIQTLSLQIISIALDCFDYNVILNSLQIGLNLDKLVDTGDFYTYVLEVPTTAVLNHLFEDKGYKELFEIISIGVDSLGLSGDTLEPEHELVEMAVHIVNKVLAVQDTFIEELVPIIMKNKRQEYFLPKNFGLHGLRSFFDAILFNIPIVAHLGLYVGSDNHGIASEALTLLLMISTCYQSGDSKFAMKNKLLTVIDSVDDSARIKEAFIMQLETPIYNTNSLALKIQLLDFINANLSFTDPVTSVAHVLLGFQVTNTFSTGPQLSTFISSHTSLLHSLVVLLLSSLHELGAERVDYAPIRLAALAFEILLKLCRNPQTSEMVLEYFASLQLFDTLMELDPQISKYTLWDGKLFKSNSQELCEDFISHNSCGALLCFLQYRSYLLQYLSLSIHSLAASELRAPIILQVQKLISNTMYSAKIFTFLDTSNFASLHSISHVGSTLSIFRNLPINLEKINLQRDCDRGVYDLHDINGLMALASRCWENNLGSVLLPISTGSIEEKSKEIALERQRLEKLVIEYTSHMMFSKMQLSITHAWVQLVQVIVSDGQLLPQERSNFILEVFGTIVPKISDYVESDKSSMEELVSLSVFLFGVYEKDKESMNREYRVDSRIYALFKVCIQGINSPVTSLALKSDFYVLANGFIVNVLKDNRMGKEVLKDLKMNSSKLVDLITNDIIYGEGTVKITGLFLLDSLVRLTEKNNESFLLESLTKGTHLLLLIRSIKNLDALLNTSSRSTTIDDILYELTAFKATVSFLTRVAESRAGAIALIENKLLQVAADCHFLAIDPELGMKLVFDEFVAGSATTVKGSMNLDTPLSWGDSANGISLFELLVPIFQLVTAVLLSVGDSNKTVIINIRKFLLKSRKLILGVLKRDTLKITTAQDVSTTRRSDEDGLKQMVKLVVLLCTLTGYHGEESSKVLLPTEVVL